MNVSILAKCKEFAEFWQRRLNRLYEIQESREKQYLCVDNDCEGFITDIKQGFYVGVFEYDIEVNDLLTFINNMKKGAEYIPEDMKATYYELNLEIVSLYDIHLGKLKSLKYWTDKDNDKTTFKKIEGILDSAYDYFITRFDELSGAIRVMQSCRGIREILQEEAEQEKQNFRNLNYQIRVRDEYKKGIERVYNYFNNEYETPYDVGRIMNDVTAICNETKEKAENMPFDENEETGFIG